MDLIILSSIWFFVALLLCHIAFYDGKRSGFSEGYKAGIATHCPDKIEVDEVSK